MASPPFSSTPIQVRQRERGELVIVRPSLVLTHRPDRFISAPESTGIVGLLWGIAGCRGVQACNVLI
jgi:hypothetical protein